MRHILATAALALLVAAPALADETTPAPPRASDWALEFGISSATLTTFDGATFSARHQVNDHAAWRYGVSVSMSTRTETSRGTDSYSSAPNREYHGESGSFTTNLSITRLAYRTTRTAVQPYLGIGARAGWAAQDDRQEATFRDYAGAQVELDTVHHNSRGPWGQIVGLFGLEWATSPTFSVHAEYGEALEYSHSRFIDDQRSFTGAGHTESGASGRSDSWRLLGAGAHAGISVFF